MPQNIYPMIAMRGVVLFPKMTLRFDIARSKSIEALKFAADNSQEVFLAAQKDTELQNPKKDDIFEIGTIATIKQIVHTQNDSYNVLVEGVSRAKIEKFMTVKPFFSVEVSPIEETEPLRETKTNEALVHTAQRLFTEFCSLNGNTSHDIILSVMGQNKPGALADYLAANTLFTYDQQQSLLSELSAVPRLKKLISMLAHLNSVLELENEIEDKVRVSMDKNQRDYYLKEQMRTISEELGEESEMDEYLEYKEKIAKLQLEPDIAEKLEKEAAKLLKMPPGAVESSIIRNYLDTCLELPWHTGVTKKHSIAEMRKILDTDHFGLQKVKDRILEHLAVGILAPEIKGQVLCLVGPPGVGKSSVARSIAHASGRNFAVISLGGVRDEADIRGHRRTYIGSMPGRVINALITAKSNNPVILLDEIDKLGNDYKGDPSSALLELLDSEQNNKFVDHFVEIPFDLSNVVFIATANYYDNIPQPLLDRMEIIQLTSYTREEKRNIAKLHLIPKQLKKHGLKKTQLRITDEAVNLLCDQYTREAGVRSLEREIAALCRKTALGIADGKFERLTVDPQQCEQLLGPPKFREEPSTRNEVGVATGLAWTSVGGDTLPIEVSVLDGSGKVELTGSLGDVMKESAHTAISYTRSRASELGIDREFYKTKDLHIHVPEGAVPKDGPSAGITMATAIISALSGRKVRDGVAMTGEITLRGNVLPIGGLKEKSMAAYRAGIKTIIIPDQNVSDKYEIDRTVLDNVTFVPVKKMDEVLAVALEEKAHD